MTKKDYIIIAQIIRNSRGMNGFEEWLRLETFLEQFCQLAKLDNKNFNADKFREFIK